MGFDEKVAEASSHRETETEPFTEVETGTLTRFISPFRAPFF